MALTTVPGPGGGGGGYRLAPRQPIPVPKDPYDPDGTIGKQEDQLRNPDPTRQALCPAPSG